MSVGASVHGVLVINGCLRSGVYGTLIIQCEMHKCTMYVHRDVGYYILYMHYDVLSIVVCACVDKLCVQ